MKWRLKLCPQVEVSSLDLQPYDLHAINREDFRGNITYMDSTRLATQLISIVNPSIFGIRCNFIKNAALGWIRGAPNPGELRQSQAGIWPRQLA